MQTSWPRSCIHHIGIDLDNTLIIYDDAFWEQARLQFQMPVTIPHQKFAVRQWLRTQPNGESLWTSLQGYVYTMGMKDAVLAPQAWEFISEAKRRNISISIVSHKTQFPAVGPTIDMRKVSIDFLKLHGIVGGATGIGLKHVYFADTRDEKIRIIDGIGCDVFIDDLLEIYDDAKFPSAVKKILIGSQSVGKPDITVCKNWLEIYEIVFGQDAQLARISLVCESKLTHYLYAKPLFVSLNCRVYEAVTESGSFLVKRYNSYKNDTRNRLKTEYESLTFLNNHHEAWVPRPVACDWQEQIGIYEFIAGDNLRGKAVSKRQINSAIDFVRRLLEYSHLPDAGRLQKASEASFSLRQYIQSVQTRIDTLSAVMPSGAIDEACMTFVHDTLLGVWQQIVNYIIATCVVRNIDIDSEFKQSDLTLSPSDFGFHNTITNDTGMYFIDFEYFGWDDPAKLLADFLLHPAMKLTNVQKTYFRTSMFALFSHTHMAQRYDLVFLILSIKWICIILNCFTREHADKQSVDICTRQLRLAQLHLAATVVEFQKHVPDGQFTQ